MTVAIQEKLCVYAVKTNRFLKTKIVIEFFAFREAIKNPLSLSACGFLFGLVIGGDNRITA